MTIEVSNIKFSYTRPVLRGVSFKVGSGELFAVLGPNGSGKSTLIKIIVGMLKPGSGSALIDGRNPASMSRRDIARAIGYVAQESTVLFPITAMEFVLQGGVPQRGVLRLQRERGLREAQWAGGGN